MPEPVFTEAMLKFHMLPPNNCQVRAFLDQIKKPETRETVEKALALPPDALPAGRLREILINIGFDVEIVPAQDHIAAHRNGRKPCRCVEFAVHEAQNR